jgi:glutamyl-tRNA reductase
VSELAEDAIVALVAHARSVPAAEREQFAGRLRNELGGEALVLGTCHRVEGYLVCPDESTRARLVAILPDGGSAKTGDAAIRHAIAVAVGRDSVVVGEDQVLHQLRSSVDEARKTGGLDPALERLFALALRAGRRARSWRQGPQRSLADVALSAVDRQVGSLIGRGVLVVGAGRMGGLAARAAVAAGAAVSVANRSADAAQSLARMTGSRTEEFDPGPRAGAFAGIIVALGGPWSISAATIEGLAASPTVVVDLSVPTALPEPAIRALGSRFLSADALALAGEGAASADEGFRRRVDGLVDLTAAEFFDWLNGRAGRATAEVLVGHADREREAELAALWRRLPDLEPEARAAIEGMTRHLASRILQAPLERLGRDADGRDAKAVRDIFAL